MTSQTWSAESYASNARFVADLGLPVVEWLEPQPGERILDLGCGDGALTEALVATGASVVGVDASEALLAAARDRGLDVRPMDGHALSFNGEFDAVFSNAALHWMKRPREVIAGVARALAPGGRFVGEFGGHGNVAAITLALTVVMQRRGFDGASLIPWFFPSPDEYADLLVEAGFTVDRIMLIPRPTPLPTGMAGWVGTFANPFFAKLPEADRPAAVAEAVELLRPVLCDGRGRWSADYVRLRFAARLER